MANSLLKQLLGEAETAPEMEHWQQAALNAIHTRFVEERVAGFTTVDGQHFPPVSREEAEARWQRSALKFREVVLNSDSAIRKRLKQSFSASNRVSGARRPEVSTPSLDQKTCPHCGGAL